MTRLQVSQYGRPREAYVFSKAKRAYIVGVVVHPTSLHLKSSSQLFWRKKSMDGNGFFTCCLLALSRSPLWLVAVLRCINRCGCPAHFISQMFLASQVVLRLRQGPKDSGPSS